MNIEQGFLQNMSKRAMRVPGFIRFPLIALAVGLPFYWMITDSGLYYTISTFQADLFGGSHYIFLSILLPILILLIPLLVFVHLIAGFFPEKK